MHLSQGKWNHLTELNLCTVKIYSGDNNIGGEGCMHLSQAKWDLLTTLDLSTTTIYLGNNNIGDKGCMHLSQAKWDHLTILCLSPKKNIFRQQQDRRQGMLAPQSGKVGPPDPTLLEYNNNIFSVQQLNR
jgi:hypothetical protein